MIKVKRLLIATILAMLVMMGLSYLWHGIILNDYKNISISFPVFMVLSTLVYFLISLIISVLLFKLEFTDHFTFKRILIGGIIGFSIYLLVFTMGLSYSERGMKHVISDFVWQMFEQGMGALIVDFCLHIYARADRFEALEED